MKLRARIERGYLHLMREMSPEDSRMMIVASVKAEEGALAESVEQVEFTVRLLGFRRMAERMAELRGMRVECVEDPDTFKRAGGDVICGHCGLKYADHPKGDLEFLTILCDGTQVKL